MHDFLLSITLGEYIAAANARSFCAFFADLQIPFLAKSYSIIADDETRHFKALRSVVNKSASVPEKIRRIYKGSTLSVAPDQSINSVYERMAVMHTVFEGAAFAYMSLLAKYKFVDTRLEPINEIAKVIMKDEARHMHEGFEAIDILKKSMVSSSIVQKTKEQVISYAKSVRDLPSLTIKGEEAFQKQLYKLFDENVQRNTRRLFQ